MAIGSSGHLPVLRIFVEHALQVRHIVVNVLLQGDDGAALAEPEQVSLAESRCEDKVRQGVHVRHKGLDLIPPLTVGDGIPFDMYVGLLFQALEDGTVLGLRGVGRIVDQTGQGHLLCLRESKLACVHGLKGTVVQLYFIPPTCRQGKYHGRRKPCGDDSFPYFVLHTFLLFLCILSCILIHFAACCIALLFSRQNPAGHPAAATSLNPLRILP